MVGIGFKLLNNQNGTHTHTYVGILYTTHIAYSYTQKLLLSFIKYYTYYHISRSRK